MIMKVDEFRVGHAAISLDEIDAEVARLATLCRIRILDSGAIERVLHQDASVCGADNPPAFAKLHDLLIMHFVVRAELSDSLGQPRTAVIESHIIDRLKKAYPELAADWPPA